jgi:hypothetical protein
VNIFWGSPCLLRVVTHIFRHAAAIFALN